MGTWGLEAMVGLGTCKLYYASGSEEAAWRVREMGGVAEEGEGKMETGGQQRRERGRNRWRWRWSSPEEAGGERLRKRAEARQRKGRRWIL